MKISDIFLSWDMYLAVAISFISIFILPNEVKPEQLKDIFNIAITVSSIIFSVFFGGLATIISTSDNKFVSFIEKDNIFTELIINFTFSLFAIFITLLLSTIGYVSSSLEIPIFSIFSFDFKYFNYIFLIIYIFIFTYSIFASLLSVLHSIEYFKKRIEFYKKIEND